MSYFKSYLNQDFNLLNQYLLSSGQLFIDAQFLPNQNSLGTKFQNYVWKRPYEIFSNPHFIINGIEPNDLDQGNLPNCWFIASVASVAQYPEYIQKVIPFNQSFAYNYTGIFRFRFFVNNEWVEVVVDDYLPVNPKTNKLVFCSNQVTPNEMFGPLLEKAFAKLMGGYSELAGDYMYRGLVYLTGGKCKSYKRLDKLNEYDRLSLWNYLFKSHKQRNIIGASIYGSDSDKLANGLVLGHAYSVLDVFEIFLHNGIHTFRPHTQEIINSNSIKILKIRNPHGNDNPYTRRYSSRDRSWEKLPPELLNQIGYKADGQFLITFNEFLENFDRVDIVLLNSFNSPTNPYFYNSNPFGFPVGGYSEQQYKNLYRVLY